MFYLTAIKFRIFTLLYKLITCILYVVEVVQFSEFSQQNESDQLNRPPQSNRTTYGHLRAGDNVFNWSNLLYVKRHPLVEQAQVGLAILGLCEVFFYLILTFSVSVSSAGFKSQFDIF
jgi:hypothetical protein